MGVANVLYATSLSKSLQKANLLAAMRELGDWNAILTTEKIHCPSTFVEHVESNAMVSPRAQRVSPPSVSLPVTIDLLHRTESNLLGTRRGQRRGFGNKRISFGRRGCLRVPPSSQPSRVAIVTPAAPRKLPYGFFGNVHKSASKPLLYLLFR
jgi:hypothetical protein